MSSREKTQADFDLERFIDMFDEALTSNDERVVNALRSLMMMVILTKPEERKNADIGPLRQIYEDLHHLNRRMQSMEETVRQLEYKNRREFEEYQKSRDVWPPHSYSSKDYWNNVTMTEEKYKAEQYKLAMKSINSGINKLK